MTSSWTNQQSPLSQRAAVRVNAELFLDGSLHTIGLLCCFILASFQLTSLVGYRSQALYLIGQIKCYLSVLFSCKILYTLSICKRLEELGKKEKNKHVAMKRINNNQNSLEKKRKRGEKWGNQQSSFCCYVLYFFINKKGKAPKMMTKHRRVKS